MTLKTLLAKLFKMTGNSFQKNVLEIEKIFAPLSTEEKYAEIIALGRRLSPFPEEFKTAHHLVKGCQSTLYLRKTSENGNLFFHACSDALISAGLAAILLKAYNGLTPETILTTPPQFLIDLGIVASLSPSRSNGLAHIHLKMKQEALAHLTHPI